MSAGKHLFKLEYSPSPLPWKLMINKQQLTKLRGNFAFILAFLDKNLKLYSKILQKSFFTAHKIAKIRKKILKRKVW